MKKILFNNRTIEVYDSIEELPIVNFQKYNKYLLIDSGIGSDVDSIDEHIVKIAKLIKKEDSQKAMQELLNMRQNLYMTCPRATRGRWLSRHIQSSRQSEEPKWATSKLLDPEKHLKNSKLPSGPSGQLDALVALTSSGC